MRRRAAFERMQGKGVVVGGAAPFELETREPLGFGMAVVVDERLRPRREPSEEREKIANPVGERDEGSKPKARGGRGSISALNGSRGAPETA